MPSLDIVSIDDLAKEIDFRGIKVYEESKDPAIIKIFQEEQKRLGLRGVTLLVPEVVPGEKHHSWFASSCSYDHGYEIRLKVTPNEQDMSLFLRIMMDMEFPFISHQERIRKLLRHELTHIKLEHVPVDAGPFAALYNIYADAAVNVYNLFH